MTASGSEAAAGPLLGLWGLGSLIGGLVASMLGGGARTAAGLVILLVALGASHSALALAHTPIVLGALLLLAGSTIAPDLRHRLRDGRRRRPEGTATEAFAWLATASAVGASLGAAGSGQRRRRSPVPPPRSPSAGRRRRRRPPIAVLRARTLPGTAATPQGATA